MRLKPVHAIGLGALAALAYTAYKGRPSKLAAGTVLLVVVLEGLEMAAPVPLEAVALEKHGPEFVAETYQIEKDYELPKGSLFSIMQAESGMNPAARNSIGAVGLIQFMPDTLAGEGYNVTPNQAAAMSALEQLALVRNFYRKWHARNKRPKTPEEVYLLTFYPAAVGRADNFVLGSEVSAARVAVVAQQNRGFDLDGNGQITIAEFKQYLKTKPRLAGTIFQP